jgi:hypothetical protein
MRPLWLAAVLLLPAAACSKPSEDDCRKAVLNLQKVRGQEGKPQGPDVEAFVRRCRSTGDNDSVRCLIAARTPAEADACQGKK